MHIHIIHSMLVVGFTFVYVCQVYDAEGGNRATESLNLLTLKKI